MSEQPEIDPKAYPRRFGWFILTVVVCAVAVSWTFNMASRVVGQRISRAYPAWAWQHGTPAMQYTASTVLVHRIQPGMSFERVLEMIGPGSADWPAIKNQAPTLDDDQVPEVVSFNLRQSGSVGIDVYFLHKRVSRAQLYD